MNIRKVAFSLIIALLTFSVTAFAQEEDPLKALRKASTLYGNYNMSPETSLDKLEEAKTNIDFVISKIAEVIEKKQVDAWLKQGNIYVELAKNITTKVKYEDALETAFAANKKAIDHPLSKKFQQVSAAKNLQAVAFEFWNRGANNYSLQNFEAAYNDYNMVLVIHDIVAPIDASADPLGGLDINAETGATTPKYPAHVEATAFLATLAEKNNEAAKLYEQLLANGNKSAVVYNGLFKAYFGSNPEKAMGFLQEGRSAFPENQELLYSEINFYLKNGETDKLEARLKDAIARDPENKSLYSVLGNTYDNLLKDEEDPAKRATLMKKAEDYYKLALEKDPEYGDVIYSLGALYYNEAVRYAKLRAALSLKAKKEYEEYSAEFKKYVIKAQPLFLQSEKINPSDRSTLIALKELYAQTNRLDLTKEFKERLTKVDEGGTIDAAFNGHPTAEELFK